MASCPQGDIVYISDPCAKKIIAINEHGVVVFNWSVVGLPFGLSVNSQLDAVVVSVNQRLKVFTRQGELIRNVNLHSTIVFVRQGIQLDDYRYVVVHGMQEIYVGSGSWYASALNRMCIVNGNGTIIQSYGGNRGSGIGQLNGPYRYSEDR
jgi:hypothetical protein